MDIERQVQIKKELESVSNVSDLEKFHKKYLGRKGEITQILKSLSEKPLEERKKIGQMVNTFKELLETLLKTKRQQIDQTMYGEKLSKEKIDITLPGHPLVDVHPHPLVQVITEIEEIFISLGFQKVTGPEIETDYYNFAALNFPPDHPARDAQDTFYIQGDKTPLLLRTHTSPVQIRTMEKHKPPLSVIIPGKVYRHEATDATHSAVFHQVEGLVVDENITFADLKGILTIFTKRMFGEDIGVRFRPSFFPFTEPSAEVDINCIICQGGKKKGRCRVCQGTGWLEMLGCGMVHPKVFDAVGYDREKYTGYAFGLGVERFAMLKYQVPDMRMFYENDLRFLSQF